MYLGLVEETGRRLRDSNWGQRSKDPLQICSKRGSNLYMMLDKIFHITK